MLAANGKQICNVDGMKIYYSSSIQTFVGKRLFRSMFLWKLAVKKRNNMRERQLVISSAPRIFISRILKRNKKSKRRNTQSKKKIGEHKRKCLNKGENKAMTVYQGGLYLSWRDLI